MWFSGRLPVQRLVKKRHTSNSRRPTLEALESRWLPTTFTVLNTNDSGPGSLRDAINQADADTGSAADTIQFNIANSGVQTIALDAASGPLPALTRPISIDGSTEGRSFTFPMIVIDGTALSSGNGLTINSSSCFVIDLVIGGFSAGSGIVIESADSTNVTGVHVSSCYVGVGADGSSPLPNGGDGVLLDNGAVDCSVSHCLISGNSTGVHIAGPSTTGNLVSDNLIGTNVTGRGPVIGNTADGIFIDGSSGNTIGAKGNYIVGSGGNGISIAGATASSNIVRDNFIGIDQGGNVNANAHDGVHIDGAPKTFVFMNTISGNAQNGVSITNAGANGTGITTNSIGVVGNQAAGNLGSGIFIGDGAQDTTIEDQNVIGANGADGVLLSGVDTTGNVIVGSFIGTDSTGAMNLGNAGDGVHILFSPNNVIGSTVGGQANIIAFNQGAGVQIGDADGF